MAVAIKEFIFRMKQWPKGRKVLFGGIALLLAVPAFFVVLFLMTASGMFGKLPGQQDLLLIRNPIASEVYSADSVLIGKYFIQERSNTTYADVPPHLVNALVATEDTRFFEHNGIDYRSLARVLVKGVIFQSNSAGGGSTLSQQLAKNLYPRRNYALLSLPINKFREMLIAHRLERAFSKEDILVLYLNTVPFGDNTYGIESAAQRFYSTSVKQLTIDQGALLVGMLKATHYYNPRLFPARAKARRDVVLSQMHKYDLISAADLSERINLPVALKYRKMTHHEGLAPYFRETLRPQLQEWCDKYNQTHEETLNLYTSGLKIYTTLDSRLQTYAEEAVATQMKQTQQRFATSGDGKYEISLHPSIVDEALRQSPHYRELVEAGTPADSIDIILNQPVLMSVFTWNGEKEVTMSPRDSVAYYMQFLNAGLLAMDPHTGAVLAWVGGIEHQFFQFDHVRPTTRRQVGSTFKPIVYAAAIEGGVRPCGFISAEKTVYNNIESWAPENAGETNYNLKYSMPGALAHSVNTVSVKILEKAGIKKTIDLAKRMGVSSELEEVPSLALGSASLSMMEMATAYACFGNGGKKTTPFYLTSITSSKGEVMEQFEAKQPEKAMSEETASAMLFMLTRVVNEGTAASIRQRFGITNEIAGKTGTTQSNTDGWFIGILPGMVVGAWVGADNPSIHFRSTASGQGARTALPIVGTFLSLSNKDRTLDTLMNQSFPAISHALRSRLDCEMSKPDNNLFRRLSGRKEKKKNFGEEKKGFLKKLFRREN